MGKGRRLLSLVGAFSIMKADFGLKRELNDVLFYNDVKNDNGVLHFHSQIELYFITDGEMEVVLNEQRRILKKGEMSVALSFNAHGYKTLDYSRSSYLIIPTYLCEEFVLLTKDKTVENPFICDKNAVDEIYGYFNELRKDGVNEIEKKGYIYVILGLIMKNTTFKNKSHTMDSSLASQILIYINEKYQEDIGPATIAKYFGYTQSYVSRQFKIAFNITLSKYITLVRLKKAIMLMREKKHNVIYCAMESGFNSVRTFYRSFFAEFGCNPKEYLAKLSDF